MGTYRDFRPFLDQFGQFCSRICHFVWRRHLVLHFRFYKFPDDGSHKSTVGKQAKVRARIAREILRP